MSLYPYLESYKVIPKKELLRGLWIPIPTKTGPNLVQPLLVCIKTYAHTRFSQSLALQRLHDIIGSIPPLVYLLLGVK